MNKRKFLRISAQIAAFAFVTVSFFLLSFPFKFIDTKEFFLTSPSLLLFAEISAVYITKGMIVLVLFAALALLFGRFFCGWLCPFGAVMDFFAFLIKPFKKREEKEPSKGLMSKYLLLFVFALFAVLGFQAVWLFEPVTVFSRFFQLAFFPFLNSVNDAFFRYLIINHNAGEELYYAINNNLFSVRTVSFAFSAVFFILFAVPVVAVFFKRRLWCRYICPLGASLGILSVKPVFGLNLAKCKTACGKCKNMCRVNAIRQDGTYLSSECVMCMDCVNLTCRVPVKAENAACASCENKEENPKQKGISRKEFLFWGSGIIAAVYMLGRKAYASAHKLKHPVIRPPGAMQEREFKQACMRCGNCMKVCVTNGLQPVFTESGLDGIWTPKMDNIIGYCEYICNACGKVCPTQAIKALPMEEKAGYKMGNAVIVKELCVPWKDGIECLVCEEHCPVPDKAIKFVKENINGSEVDVPVVDYHLCTGCGICENKCPVEGKKRGVIVEPL